VVHDKYRARSTALTKDILHVKHATTDFLGRSIQSALLKLRWSQKPGKRYADEYAAICSSCIEQFANHFIDKACSQYDRYCSLANIGLVIMLTDGGMVSI
jgi:hypothetical protein